MAKTKKNLSKKKAALKQGADDVLDFVQSLQKKKANEKLTTPKKIEAKKAGSANEGVVLHRKEGLGAFITEKYNAEKAARKGTKNVQFRLDFERFDRLEDAIKKLPGKQTLQTIYSQLTEAFLSDMEGN